MIISQAEFQRQRKEKVGGGQRGREERERERERETDRETERQRLWKSRKNKQVKAFVHAAIYTPITPLC